MLFGGEMRAKWSLVGGLVGLLFLGLLVGKYWGVWHAQAASTPPSTSDGSSTLPKGDLYLMLSQDFFTAMEKLAKSDMTYGDRQESLLEQIAVSSQFAVKTNLTLIRQNEQIIRLLEELNRRQFQEGR